MYDGLLREEYGELVLSAVVPAAPEVPEAIMLRKPVCHHKPTRRRREGVRRGGGGARGAAVVQCNVPGGGRLTWASSTT
jgi:hypothetical protein